MSSHSSTSDIGQRKPSSKRASSRPTRPPKQSSSPIRQPSCSFEQPTSSSQSRSTIFNQPYYTSSTFQGLSSSSLQQQSLTSLTRTPPSTKYPKPSLVSTYDAFHPASTSKNTRSRADVLANTDSQSDTQSDTTSQHEQFAEVDSRPPNQRVLPQPSASLSHPTLSHPSYTLSHPEVNQLPLHEDLHHDLESLHSDNQSSTSIDTMPNEQQPYHDHVEEPPALLAAPSATSDFSTTEKAKSNIISFINRYQPTQHGLPPETVKQLVELLVSLTPKSLQWSAIKFQIISAPSTMTEVQLYSLQQQLIQTSPWRPNFGRGRGNSNNNNNTGNWRGGRGRGNFRGTGNSPAIEHVDA